MAWYNGTALLDAGVVPDQPIEEFTIERGAWLDASAEELSWLHDVLLYTNQEANVQHRLSGDVVVRIRYSTPCITSLGRAA